MAEEKTTEQKLVDKINNILNEFRNKSNGEIKQNDLAKLIGVSTATISRSKSLVHGTSTTTLNKLCENLESLLQDYQDNPNKFLERIAKEEDNSTDVLVEKIVKSIEKGKSDDKKNKKLHEGKSKQKRNWFFSFKGRVISFLFFLTLAIIIISYIKRDKVVTWDDLFIDNSLDSLEHRGWKYFNKSEKYIEDQDSGSLKIYTLEGDFGNNENPIKNLLVRKITCTRCSIEVKIFDFNPRQPWQQVGIFLFDELDGKYDPANYLRYTFAYGGSNPSPTSKWWQILQAYLHKEGKLIDDGEGIVQGVNYVANKHRPIDTLWLKVLVDNGKLSLRYKKEHSWKQYQTFKSDLRGNFDDALSKFNLEPKFIGIGGFSGHKVRSDGDLIKADTIFGRFDHVKIKSIE